MIFEGAFMELWIFEVTCLILEQISTIVSIFVERRIGERFQNFSVYYLGYFLIVCKISWILGVYFINGQFLNKRTMLREGRVNGLELCFNGWTN